MTTWNSIAVMTAALITFQSMAEGFFLYSNSNNNNKKTSTDRQFSSNPNNFYRDIGLAQQNNWGAQYAFDGAGPMTVALPVAVPIQSQVAPVPPSLRGTVHNVQLVPCLCPVSRDVDSPYISSSPVKPNQQLEPLQQPSAYLVQSQQAPSQPT